MERRKVFFGSIENALKFVKIVDNMNAVVWLINGAKMINGRSLLGIFSLDLNQPVDLEVRGDENTRKETIHALHDYIL